MQEDQVLASPNSWPVFSSMLPAVLGVGVAALLIGTLGTWAFVRLAPRWGFVDDPGHRKIHRTPMPLGGGVAIYVALLLPISAAMTYVTLFDAPTGVDGRYWSGAREQTGLAALFLGAAGLLTGLGLVDDKKALGPYVKLVTQLLIVGGFVVFSGVRALTFLDGATPTGALPSLVLTVLWVAGVTNAFNFLDNMDGLSAGVAAVCTLTLLVLTLLIGQWFVAATLAALLGGLLGFLAFNFPPARVFMGDAGSLLIGFVLGVLTVQTTFLPQGQALAAGWYAVFAPLVILALPLYDFVTVTVIRLSRGKSPFVGDTNHFSHRLVARGMTRRSAVICLYFVTAATSIGAVLLVYVPSRLPAMLVFAQTLLILGVVRLLEKDPAVADRPPPS